MATVQFNCFGSTVPNSTGSWSENYTLGFNFTPVIPMTMIGVRYYKFAADVGTLVALAYRASDQTLLAQKDFSGQTASGWQTQLFDTPVSLSSGVEYVGAFYKPGGNTAGNAGNWVDPFNLFTAPARVGVSGNFNSAGRYSTANVGSPSFPQNNISAWYGVDAILEFDDANVPTLKRTAKGYPTQRASGIMIDGLKPLTRGVRKETVEGNPNPPCLAIDNPGVHRFQWGVLAGTRTLKMDMKQASNVAAPYRPSFIVKANPSIGVNADVTGTAGAGTGWVTVGPVTVTPSSDGVLTVELWNNDIGTFNSPAYFDQMVKT